ncbi:reverse transcriptase N-terminal domain-containing protein (plasmid) [Phormidium sp. CLA17]|nr:reverse transcriptase N-terminal domain-containing protein [Leptolyngbya sp. Cla-17]
MGELTTTYEWKSIPWRKLERKVFKLQKQIYRAARVCMTSTKNFQSSFPVILKRCSYPSLITRPESGNGMK